MKPNYSKKSDSLAQLYPISAIFQSIQH